MSNHDISNIFREEFPQRAELASWKRRLKKVYGLSFEQYNELLEKQGHRCALCGKHQSELNRRLAVEHDHSTMEIRSLCCAYCNLRVIGRHRKDNVQKLYDYLNKPYTGWFVPVKKKKKRKKRNGKRSVRRNRFKE